jgi:hypothetical protein
MILKKVVCAVSRIPDGEMVLEKSTNREIEKALETAWTSLERVINFKSVLPQRSLTSE